MAFLDDLQHLPSRVKQRAFKRTSYERMSASATVQSHNPMKKVLGPQALTLLCLGHIIGSGIFVLTGVAARTLAGPSVVVSYAVGAVTAGLAAMAYCELGTALPLAGASFNYVLATFGEFPAWLTVMTMAADSILGGGAMCRSWSSYVAVMLHQPSNFFQIPAGPFQLDFVAAGATLVVTAILVSGSLNTAWVNGVGKVALLSIIGLVLALSYQYSDPRNWEDFFPFGVQGVFNGAAIIYFSYGGYNACCNFAEEAKNPARDLPIAIFTSLGMSTVLYLLMAAAITLMVPWQLIDLAAPFSEAFITLGLGWAAQLVSIGAVIAIGSVVLVSMMATTREFLVMARHSLIPGWLAEVHPTLGTPYRVIIGYGLVKATMALLTDFETLAKLTSVGTMFVTGMVAACLLFRRYHDGSSSAAPAVRRLFGLLAASFGFAIAFCFGLPVYFWAVLLALWALAASSFYTLPQVNVPTIGFAVPLVPVLMSISILGSSVLMMSLGRTALLRFFVVFALVVILYFVYGVHSAARLEGDVTHYMAVRAAEEGLQAKQEDKVPRKSRAEVALSDRSEGSSHASEDYRIQAELSAETASLLIPPPHVTEDQSHEDLQEGFIAAESLPLR